MYEAPAASVLTLAPRPQPQRRAAPTAEASRHRRAAPRRWPPYVVVGSLGPLIGVVLYSSAGRDDAHITYWAARVLAETGEIVNYNGDRIEQSSSLLQVLLIAAISRLTTLPVPTVGFATAVIAGGATAVVAFRLGCRFSARAGWLAGAFTGTGAYLAYWSFGGLETTLAALLLLSTLGACSRFAEGGRGPERRRLLAACAVLIGLDVMVRPESGLVLLLALALAGGTVFVVTRARRSVAPLAALGLLAGASYLTLGGLRLLYFGSFVPNPVSAKVSGLQLEEGWRYLQESLWRPGMLLLVGLALCGAAHAVRRRSILGTLLACGAAAHLGFLAASGGDWMEAGRLLVPAVPLMAVLAAVAVDRVGRRQFAVGLSGLLLVAQLTDAVAVAHDLSTGKPVWSEVAWSEAPDDLPAWTGWFEHQSRLRVRDTTFAERLIDVVDVLRPVVGRPVAVASGQAGVAMYYLMARRSGDVRFIDRMSLSTDDFDHCRGGRYQTPYGTGVEYGYWFDHLAECRLPMPDVIFDLGRFAARPSLHSRYVPVFQTGGRIESTSRLLPGRRIVATQVLAVRRDLVPAAMAAESGPRPDHL